MEIEFTQGKFQSLINQATNIREEQTEFFYSVTFNIGKKTFSYEYDDMYTEYYSIDGQHLFYANQNNVYCQKLRKMINKRISELTVNPTEELICLF